MDEIVIISGKGGTGKTSIAASFAALATNKIVVDCDVDAADMHLILNPEIKYEEDFEGGKEAVLDHDTCVKCGTCMDLCRFGAISRIDKKYIVDPLKCEGCNVCAWFCSVNAIEMKSKISGKWFISDTRHGPLVHAALGIAEDNSGKLVSTIRGKAKEIAEEKGYDHIIIDGSPGIGCPVIASITGAALVLIVTEPTVSGLHDLKRVVELIHHFHIKGMVCINKYDLNSEMADKIENFCTENGIDIAARISYDTDFTKAQIESKSLVEYSAGKTAQSIKSMWEKILVRKDTWSK
ncbi:MAG: (4Fe-4S)-binding protein [bacterium]|nr:(4Fe-4S)-binding protein [bacterium]